MKHVGLAALLCAVSLVGCSYFKKRAERAEYERAALALQPTFSSFAAIRDRTLMSRGKLVELDGKGSGAMGSAMYEEGERCAKAGEELAALKVETQYEDVLLKSYVSSIGEDLEYASLSLKCTELELENLPECAESCDAMFRKVEEDAEAFRKAAKEIYDLEVAAIPPRK